MLYPIRLVVLLGAVLSLFFSIAAQDCTCPQFQIVSGLEMVKAGDTVEFEVASAVDPSVQSYKYEWTVSAGTIISGQGTGKIAVQTTREMLYPEPSGTPTPNASDPHGFIISGISGRIPKLTVTTAPVIPEGTCNPMSASVQIGRMNREKNKPADVTDISLSADELILPCRPGHLRHPDAKPASASMVIDVAVTALDPENDVLTYNYTVSGGKIVGTGSNVKWDLSDAAPGSYTITAGVDDGCGICGKTQTKTVTVAQSDCGGGCVCASVELAGPLDDALKAGENVFTANVTPGTYEPTYEWVVDGGEIAHGQGTPSIAVKMDEETLRSNKSVTVRIGGAPSSCACATEQTLRYVSGRRNP